MRISKVWLLFTSAVSSVLADTTASSTNTKYPKSISLTYEIIGVKSSPSQLAQVLYDPKTLKSHLSSWTPPSTDFLKSTSQEPTSHQLVRISLPDGSFTVSSLAAFDSSLSQYIDLWLTSSPDPNTDGTVFSASIASSSPPPLTEEDIRQKRKEERAKAKGKPIPSRKPSPKPKSKKGKPAEVEVERGPVVKVNLLRASEGPTPKLLTRKPPQVDAEGREVVPEEQVEKTFFQKYWWVFLIATVLMMGGGGEK